MTTFYVVRHGETEWNKAGRIQGQQNSVLNEEGLSQANAAARALKRMPPKSLTQLVSSDLGRTLQTAVPIAAALGLPVQQDNRLRERAFGVFEGLERTQMQAQYPQEFARWQSRDPHYRVPGGESLEDMRARLSASFHEMAARWPHENVVVISHGGVLDVLYRIAMNIASEAPRTWTLANASLNLIAIDAALQWKVLDWGDVAHLAQSEDESFV